MVWGFRLGEADERIRLGDGSILDHLFVEHLLLFSLLLHHCAQFRAKLCLCGVQVTQDWAILG